MTNKCIILGASHAAAQLVTSLRQEGWEGEIQVISDEPYLPYHRPPLSKAFLAGDKSIDDLQIRPQSFYDKLNVRFQQGRVTQINRLEKSLLLESGEELQFSKLALCTGARVKKVSLPGSDLKGIHYLRNIADVQGLQGDIGEGKRVVIIGGGYIGLEAASAMRKLGMYATVLERSSRILQRVSAPELSAFYQRIHTEEGTDIRTNMSVSKFVGDSYVEKVVCEDGTEFQADLVVIGIGVNPNVELAESGGISVDNGILVDKHCQTNDPDIVAAGDCTRHFNEIYGRSLRLESVPNANEQAKVAAATICGHDKEYNSLPWFWSDQYDLKLQISGLSEGYDQIIVRKDPDKDRSFAAFYFKKGKLISADCINRPQEFMLSKKIISQSLNVDPERLENNSIPVKELL
jgi:3-phenylpropionate/trans-cinnamate dioxygenase ferredoxin reductase component